MTSEHHERVFTLFRACCELPVEERDTYLSQHCGTDTALRGEIEALLAHDEAHSEFLGSPLVDNLDRILALPATLPGRVGRYRMLEKIGEGGMGVVYKAEQDQPQRVVAIKLLRFSASSRLTQRFYREAELLGRLKHPGIAHIYEAGIAGSGTESLPFIAMEFVDGRPLKEFAHSASLDLTARLRLLIQICDAVHHAHQKGVIHRDLKPANILVADQGQPKILDFGIARAVDSDLQPATIATNSGELIGTILYMSPEQAAGHAGEIDIRSDVYALGVVGYELLVDRLPYDLHQKSLPEMARAIQETEPRPLSQGTTRFSGDLETIFAKSLAKEAQRRYQSALAFAEDLARYLNDEPIQARPASPVYQIQKFARRNALLVGSSLGMLLLLIVGAAGMTMLAMRLSRQLERAEKLQAETELARADAEESRKSAEESAEVQSAISGFLQDVFAAASPYVGRKDITVAEALDLAAEHVEEKLAAHPDAASAVRMRLADTFFSLGRQREAVAQMEAALKTSLARKPPPILDIAMMRATLGQLHQGFGNLELARSHLQAAMELIDDPSLRDQPVRSLTLVNFGALLVAENRDAEAMPILRESLALRRKEFGDLHPYTLTVLNNLAVATRRGGSQAEALELSEENMRLHLEALGEQHPNSIGGIYNHADLLREAGEFAQSEILFKRCIALAVDHLPTRHFLLGKYRSGYGDLLRRMQRYEESENQLEEGYSIQTEQLGEEHPDSIRTKERLAQLHQAWQRP